MEVKAVPSYEWMLDFLYRVVTAAISLALNPDFTHDQDGKPTVVFYDWFDPNLKFANVLCSFLKLCYGRLDELCLLNAHYQYYDKRVSNCLFTYNEALSEIFDNLMFPSHLIQLLDLITRMPCYKCRSCVGTIHGTKS